MFELIQSNIKAVVVSDTPGDATNGKDNGNSSLGQPTALYVNCVNIMYWLKNCLWDFIY